MSGTCVCTNASPNRSAPHDARHHIARGGTAATRTACQHLRLTRIAQTLPSLLESAAQQELSYSAVLETLLATEVAAKHEKHQAMRSQMARFPFHKTLDGFD